jgi:hypothetical protein
MQTRIAFGGSLERAAATGNGPSRFNNVSTTRRQRIMRSLKTILAASLVLGLSFAAYADLQTVTTDGSLRIRGNMYEFDSLGDQSWVEMRTRLGVQADFTDGVSAYIEFDSFDVWGEDFRSNWVTGVDGRAATGNDVEIYQAYINATEMWGTPLQLRIGRQELSFGSEWMLGVNDAAAAAPGLGIGWGLSYDGIRATYAVDTFSIDAFWAKLAETFGDFGDDDVDLYGVYFSYLGLDDHVIDLYWLYVRENNETFGLRAGTGGPATGVFPMARDFALFGTGKENDANLHTIGLRGAGTFGAFDYEAEIAFQFGEVELTGGLFNDPELDYSEFGGNLEVGYTFDVEWTPRVFLGLAYFGGGDAGDTGGLFRAPGNDLAFNRMFSNWEYTEFFANTEESNLLIFRGGISAAPTESIELALLASYFQVDDALETGWWFWGDDEDDDLGIELGLYADYQYSSDLVFRAGYAHFFGGDALGNNNPGWFEAGHPGNPVLFNGLAFTGADDDDDYDYLFVETEVKF